MAALYIVLQTSDGTTTATVIACGLYKEDINSIGSDVNSMDTKIGIDICCKHALNILTKLFRQELMNVKVIVNIATSGDKTIAAWITEAIQEVGIDGLNEIQDRFIYVDELVVIEGCEIEKGYINKTLRVSVSVARNNNNVNSSTILSVGAVSVTGVGDKGDGTLSIRECQLADLGKCNQRNINKESSLIIDGYGDKYATSKQLQNKTETESDTIATDRLY